MAIIPQKGSALFVPIMVALFLFSVTVDKNGFVSRVLYGSYGGCCAFFSTTLQMLVYCSGIIK